jgi:hypothetical protein
LKETGATPVSVWFGPDARFVQFRLYYEAGSEVFSDGFLHRITVISDDQIQGPAIQLQKQETPAVQSSGQT